MRAWVVALALVLYATPGRATGPEVPVVVPGTEAVIGRIGREDGSFPFGIEATSDRAACMMDPRAVSVPQLRAVIREAARDRVEAYRSMVRLTDPCMRAKGWRFTSCGSIGAPECPPPVPPGLVPETLARPGDEAERQAGAEGSP